MRQVRYSAGPQAVAESIFDIIYLAFDLTAALIFFDKAGSDPAILLFGFLAAVLGGGDAFHLIPRILVNLQGPDGDSDEKLGRGLMITSVSMTVFYVLLFAVWSTLYPDLRLPGVLTVSVYSLAALRIGLCLMPQNNWLKPEGNARWSLYRNLPFFALGIIMAVLFFISAGQYDDGLKHMGIAILTSFACYLPVALWSKKQPKLGMLMIPKTCAYVWMIWMGFSLIWN